MVRKLLFLALLALPLTGWTQHVTVETKYRAPLREVLEEISRRFDVKLVYSRSILTEKATAEGEAPEEKTIDYAYYRFSPDLKTTLDRILPLADLTYTDNGDGSLSIKPYNYAMVSPQEGKKRLDAVAARVTGREAWEERKSRIRACLEETFETELLRKHLIGRMEFSQERKKNGYSVCNFAMETLPGVYCFGNVYYPTGKRKNLPLVINPNGHGPAGRFGESVRNRCAVYARMGAVAVSLDMFGYGESAAQITEKDAHRNSVAGKIQVLNLIAVLDFFTAQEFIDPDRIGITGESGGGTQTFLLTALDDRVAVSAPVVQISSYFHGGCPCESGLPIHLCGEGTTNAEIAAFAAPRPQLIVSDGQDWTAHTPEIEYPFVRGIYELYGAGNRVANRHFPDEGHDYRFTKRAAVYEFMAENLGLNIGKVRTRAGEIDEGFVAPEPEETLRIYGSSGVSAHDPSAVTTLEGLYELLEQLRNQ